MRRSCAPSVKNPEKRKSEDVLTTATNVSAKRDENSSPTVKRLKGNKLAFNIQWRDPSKKKHKTWKGNGILEIQLERNHAVFLDHTGKYMGGTDKFKTSDLENGFQMLVGGKEIEILEQIDNDEDYWTTRKMFMENREWGKEEWQPPEEKNEQKKSNIPSGCIIQPMLQLNPMIQRNKQKHINKPAVEPKITENNDNSNGSSEENALPISESLSKKLRHHQREGVAFLYNCLAGQDENDQNEKYGCILADEMGLGKTLQVLTVANMLLRQGTKRKLQRILIASPSSLIRNWNSEIHKWLHAERMYGFIVDGSCSAANRKLSAYAKQQHVPFVIVSYETLVSQIQQFQALQFDMLVCDEGHRLKNADTKTYKALRELNIKRCILLTGTPIQNVLSEFYALADFVKPGVFGARNEFRRDFEIPIEKGSSSSASAEEKRIAAECNEQLKNISSTFLIRRCQSLNSNYLPKKLEYICLLCPSKLQHLLLRQALRFYDVKNMHDGQEVSPLEAIAILRKICSHPYLIKRIKKENFLTKSLARHMIDVKQLNITDSTKLSFVKHLLLNAVSKQREKVVLVSYHTKTLNVLQELCDNLSLKYLRLDGSTSTIDRNNIVTKFNSHNKNLEDEEFVLLLSAKAGGVGLNLIGASRLVLYDIDWNPANDAQATSRIWREGQQKDVHIYRLITAGCIDEKIFQRQIAKTSLGGFLELADNGTTKFSAEELQDLFYLQYDYSCCDTHQSLKCDCVGDGQNQNNVESSDSKQINELNHWRHWQPDFDETFMTNACLWDAKEDLVYLFSNETINETPVRD